MSRNPNLSEKRSREKRLRDRPVRTGKAAVPSQQDFSSETAAPVIAGSVIAKLLAYGLADHQAGKLGEAERVYRRILELNAEHAEALHLLGMIAFQTGHCAAAAELISRAILENDSDHRYFTNMGNVLLGLRRPEEATGCYRRALQLNPASAGAHSNLGLALQFLG